VVLTPREMYQTVNRLCEVGREKCPLQEHILGLKEPRLRKLVRVYHTEQSDHRRGAKSELRAET
jgi:hypothetical protein